ncbi:cytochrome p450 [Moniliophthora roreri MCA 2997]|uniref:Cytochrome p450 n=1 Tax=Moniliophthora roreri (strain MCA 2997) TaxID=1381753 RepID=V2X367_MONRO|nr:cytochrome p450 [Moniliophthora roreri MCA 2997]
MSTLALSALALGITNHLYFKQNEPTAQTFIPTVLFLLTQPLLLVYLAEVSISNVLLSYISFFASLVSSIVIYRLSPLHPLHSVPGPWLARLTKFWRAYVCAMGKQYLTLKELHDHYGPIVRTGPNEGQAYVPRKDARTKGSVLVLNGEDHRNRRRLWNRGMNTDSLREYEEIIRRRARELSEALARASKKAGSKGVDLNEWFSFFSFDFMADMAFGGGSNMMASGEDEHGYLQMIEDGSRYVDIICQLPWLSIVLESYVPSMKRAILRLRNFGLKWSTERVQRGGTTKDLWYHLSDEANLEEDRPALQTIAGEGVLAIIAGSDTTSAALTYTIYYLLRNPECYKKAREEVDEVFTGGTVDALDTKLYGNLDYVAACINESMRLMPPVPCNGPREVSAGGKVLCGQYLPERTQVQIPPYSIHRNPAHSSPQTNEYVPERWLPGAEAKGYFTNADAFIPFSYGPSNCAGRNLAKREMMMVLAMLLQQFDICFGTGEEEQWVEGWVKRSREYFVTTRDPLWVVLSPR